MSRTTYLERYAWKEPLFPNYQPDEDLGLIVVIPSYKEENLIQTLDSLTSCKPPQANVLILIVINESERADEDIKHINKTSRQLLSNYSSQFEICHSHIQLPYKKAGVGLARKIGMDEGVRIFQKIQKDGILICCDADCLCQDNYLVEIEQAFVEGSTNAGIIFYEHQLHGENHGAILNYELYLRYYINALRFAGFPYAHQTLGSCIAVRSSVYQKQGGMNTRKAGEDFYFLNKVIPLGGFKEINTSTIFPSDRVSDRVPFGTGKAVDDLLKSELAFAVYNPLIFQDLKDFFDQVEKIWDGLKLSIPTSIQTFLGDTYLDQIQEVKSQTSSYETFNKRFFHWFDAFKILKYVHACRDHHYSNILLEEALSWLGQTYVGTLPTNLEEALTDLRSFDRKGLNQIE